jgi:hypothetical protein
MSEIQPPTPEEAVAAKRYTVMNLVRLGSVVGVVLGIAIAQGALALPYALGVLLAAAGLLAFFFGPPWLARRWKASDRAGQSDREQ